MKAQEKEDTLQAEGLDRQRQVHPSRRQDAGNVTTTRRHDYRSGSRCHLGLLIRQRRSVPLS